MNFGLIGFGQTELINMIDILMFEILKFGNVQLLVTLFSDFNEKPLKLPVYEPWSTYAPPTPQGLVIVKFFDYTLKLVTPTLPY